MQRTALVFLCLLSFSSAADGLYTRNLACENQSSTRSKEVCTALQGALEWRWTGHAIISPSYRMEIERVREIYCSLPIAGADTPILVDMALASANTGEMRQTQINNGVLSLLSMLGHKAVERFPPLDEIPDEKKRNAVRYLREHIMLTIEESSTSIFNPSHDQYILRDGCI